MNLRAYQNSAIVLFFALLMVGAMLFKGMVSKEVRVEREKMAQELAQIEQIVQLQHLWRDKSILKKLKRLEKFGTASTRKWSLRGKKLVATYTSLSAKSVNRLINKILNLAVQIERLELKKEGEMYRLEFVCKW
jgi:hypothetical protein